MVKYIPMGLKTKGGVTVEIILDKTLLISARGAEKVGFNFLRGMEG
jgi:hypothetical protein